MVTVQKEALTTLRRSRQTTVQLSPKSESELLAELKLSRVSPFFLSLSLFSSFTPFFPQDDQMTRILKTSHDSYKSPQTAS